MFGPEDYAYNASSIIEFDNRQIVGYKRYRRKVIVSQRLISTLQAHDPRDDLILLDWSPYSIFFKYHQTQRLDIPRFGGALKNITTFCRLTYFDDGVLKYGWNNSTGRDFGSVVSTIVETTEAVADVLGYIDEDYDDLNKDNYIFDMPAITFIFIVILCIATTSLAISVCILFKCLWNQKQKRYYSKVKMVDSDAGMDIIDNEKENLNQK